MRPTRFTLALLTALALPGLALATPGAQPVPIPIAKVACTIDSTDGTTRQTVSRPTVTTRVGRAAEVSLRAAAGEAHPAHTLRVKLKPTEKALEGEARIEIDGQPPIVKAVHIENSGTWVTLNVAGTFDYLMDCTVDRSFQDPPPSKPINS